MIDYKKKYLKYKLKYLKIKSHKSKNNFYGGMECDEKQENNENNISINLKHYSGEEETIDSFTSDIQLIDVIKKSDYYDPYERYEIFFGNEKLQLDETLKSYEIEDGGVLDFKKLSDEEYLEKILEELIELNPHIEKKYIEEINESMSENLNLYSLNINKFPKYVKIKGSLELSDNDLSSVPNYLWVGNDLSLNYNSIKQFTNENENYSDNLYVGNTIDLSDTLLKKIEDKKILKKFKIISTIPEPVPEDFYCHGCETGTSCIEAHCEECNRLNGFI